MTETTEGSIVRLAGEGETTSPFGDTYAIRARTMEAEVFAYVHPEDDSLATICSNE